MEAKKPRKTAIGIVTSNKMNKSAVIQINYIKKHALYKKYIQRSKKYMVHDENNLCDIGDKVEIKQTRPLSKRKQWVVTKILEKAKRL